MASYLYTGDGFVKTPEYCDKKWTTYSVKLAADVEHCCYLDEDHEDLCICGFCDMQVEHPK